MKRSVVAVIGLAGSLLLSASAHAAGKKADCNTCEAGQGKAVCCKTMIANHCPHVSCCEVGNAGFFTSKSCSLCATHRAEAAGKTHAKHAAASCNTCEGIGNAAFFTATASCCGKHSAPAATGCASCDAAAAKKK